MLFTAFGVAAGIALGGLGFGQRWGRGSPVQTGHEAHSASCTMGTGDLCPGIKRLGRDVDQPPRSNTEDE